MTKLPTIAVIGGGSWATATVKILSDNLIEKNVYWWMRDENAITHIQNYRHHPNYLSAIEIKLSAANISSNLSEIVKNADYLLLNIPAAFLKQTLADISAEDMKAKKVISAIKGIIPEDNLIIADFLHQKKQIPYKDILVVTGPCHAEEVSLEKLSYLTVAGLDEQLVSTFASFLNTRYIKTNLSDDIFGTEYAAVLKNIYAVASGICHAVGFGDNFQAVLISNAIREIKRFVNVAHPIQRDINESAYLGDLLVTAYSQFSRNRTFGHMIGKGYSVKAAQLEMNMIAEGYFAVNSMHHINQQYQVDMPICEAVYQIIYEKASPIQIMQQLTTKLD